MPVCSNSGRLNFKITLLVIVVFLYYPFINILIGLWTTDDVLDMYDMYEKDDHKFEYITKTLENFFAINEADTLLCISDIETLLR